MLLGMGYWYRTVLAVCDVPMTYRIGTIDSRFNIGEGEVRNAISSAESLWEDGTDRNLFTYDPEGEIVVNFVYDERQQSADAQKQYEKTLEKKEGVSDSVRSEYENLVKKYDALRASYEKEVDVYEVKLDTYNKEVADWNDRGGAPKDVFERLGKTKTSLGIEEKRLGGLSRELNGLVAKINALSSKGNALVSDYNSLVNEYNEEFGEVKEFTQGEYTDRTITIYEFGDETELTIVLAHELGHALGIGHVEGETSFMYHHMGAQSLEGGLTPFDHSAFTTECGATDESVAKTLAHLRSVLLGMLRTLGG
jgi:archaellum component FlaC